MLHRTFAIDDKLGRFRADLEEAYSAGYSDGAKDTREAILRAAQAPSDIAKNVQQPSPQTDKAQAPARRAPKGLAEDVIASVLKDHGGLSLQELQDRVRQADARVAGSTVHGEMRRGLQAGRYERQGSRWYLNNSAGAPSKASPADFSNTKQEAHMEPP